MLRLTLTEFADHKVFARFDTGDGVSITVYNRTDNVTEVLTSNVCSEIGGTGIFEWNFSNLTTQPTYLTQYIWVMSNGASEQDGVSVAGGYPETILTKLNELIVTPGGLMNYENPWFVGNLPAGGTVTIKVYGSLGVEEALDDSDCDEFVPGYYRWSTVNMTTYPGTVGSYFWVMVDSDSGRTTWGVGPIGTPEDIGEVTADAVWDAARADYTDAGSMGETMTDTQAVAESLDEMIEDDGLGNKRFTEKALEEGPGTDPADIFAYVPTGLEPAGSIADRTVDITDNTDRVDGLIENSGGDRFTEKALEEAPTGGGGITAQEIWEYILTGRDSAADVVLSIQDVVEDLNNLSESDMIRIITALQRRLNPNGGIDV